MMKNCLHHLLLLVAVLALCGCSARRFIPEGGYLLDRVTVVSDDKDVKPAPLQGYVRQHPNARWFSLFKVPMGTYCLSGTDSTRALNRFLRRMGEAPVVYDSLKARRTQDNMEVAVQNMGYLNARVEVEKQVKHHKMSLKYRIIPGERYYVRHIDYHIQDTALAREYEEAKKTTLLSEGMAFDLNALDAERSRIHTLFQDKGYYAFNKEFVRYRADTTVGNRKVDVELIIPPYRRSGSNLEQPHRRYYIRNINYLNDVSREQLQDSLTKLEFTTYGNHPIYYDDKLTLRRRLFADRTVLHAGNLYRESDKQATYANFSRLSALAASAIRMEEVGEQSDSLDCYISLHTNKRHSFNVEVEGTNSAGDLGAAVATSYQNRNLFRGSELFNFKVRGAFEAITGLEGYSDENYVEWSAEASLTFPDFRIPFLSRDYRRRIRATSEVAVMFDSQNRPEFHRRVLTGQLRYRWSRPNRRLMRRFDLLNLNYVFMPWVSSTFRRDYLDDAGDRNAILRYNYENLFIMGMGYSFTYNSRPGAQPGSTGGTNAVVIRCNVESAGNLLYGASRLFKTQKNGDDQYTLMNIAYAQFVKGDFDISKSFRFDDRNSLALHFGLGVAYPYGNSKILPYEKRYFSGGANSVRGWSVRELGPGTFRGTDGRIDFINQTGDIKLDVNVEYRTSLFWKLQAAAFVDAGNIWTIRSYAEQPGGQFHFHSFWREIAVAYGLGLRLNFDYFILRLDGGMKAINPAYEEERLHYPLLHPDFSRDFTLHFAVGLPF